MIIQLRLTNSKLSSKISGECGRKCLNNIYTQDKRTHYSQGVKRERLYGNQVGCNAVWVIGDPRLDQVDSS